MGEAFTAPTRGTAIVPAQEYADASIQRAIAGERLTGDDATLIREYIARMRASSGIDTARANRIAFALVNWRRFIVRQR